MGGGEGGGEGGHVFSVYTSHVVQCVISILVVVFHVQVKMEWWEDKKAVKAIRDFAILRGLIKWSSSNPCDSLVVNLSVSLTPFKFSRDLFHQARSIQRDINLLVDAISRDYQFLLETLER